MCGAGEEVMTDAHDGLHPLRPLTGEKSFGKGVPITFFASSGCMFINILAPQVRSSSAPYARCRGEDAEAGGSGRRRRMASFCSGPANQCRPGQVGERSTRVPARSLLATY